jgi:hypothetical protein
MGGIAVGALSRQRLLFAAGPLDREDRVFFDF